jgi:hypothetical protein
MTILKTIRGTLANLVACLLVAMFGSDIAIAQEAVDTDVQAELAWTPGTPIAFEVGELPGVAIGDPVPTGSVIDLATLNEFAQLRWEQYPLLQRFRIENDGHWAVNFEDRLQAAGVRDGDGNLCTWQACGGTFMFVNQDSVFTTEDSFVPVRGGEYYMPVGIIPNELYDPWLAAELNARELAEERFNQRLEGLPGEIDALAAIVDQLAQFDGQLTEELAEQGQAIGTVALQSQAADQALGGRVDGADNAIAAATARIAAVEEVLEALPEELAQFVTEEQLAAAVEDLVTSDQISGFQTAEEMRALVLSELLAQDFVTATDLNQRGFLTASDIEGFVTGDVVDQKIADTMPATWQLWLPLILAALALLGLIRAVLLARRLFNKYKEKQEAENRDLNEKVAAIAVARQKQEGRLGDHEERLSDIAYAVSPGQYDRKKVAVDYLLKQEMGTEIPLTIYVETELYSVLVKVVEYDYGQGPVRAYAFEGIKRSARNDAPPVPLIRESQVATWVERAAFNPVLLNHRTESQAAA